MKNCITLCSIALLLAGVASAAPAATIVQNNYSYVLPGLPNYGIAQGSLFALKGTGIGPVQTPTLPDLSKGPLTTNLSSVTVSVTVNGTTVLCPLYYVSDKQIAGVLPSNTPVGTGKMTVTYNGQTSSTDITVVPAAFGMGTLTGDGKGAAIAVDASNSNALVLPTASANPGDVLVLWGSGLGASPGDESKYPFPQTDLKANVKVFIGGQQATVAYAGRSQFPAVDQINVVVPQGVSGCTVGVVVQTGNYVSNAGTISVAPTGRICSDQAINGLSSADLQALLGKSTIRLGFIDLLKVTSSTPSITFGGVTIPGSTTTSDTALAEFTQYTPIQIATQGGLSFQQTSFGSCSVYQVQGTVSGIPQVTPPVILDAGAFTMRLPDNSTRALTKEPTSGLYFLSGSDATGSKTPLFIPAAGGQFTFTNTGGTDVGVISGAQIIMPPALKWTNADAISTIVRAQGVTVNWDTANPYNGYVTISGSSISINGTDVSTALASGFTCTAPYSAGTFKVESYVLLALVPGSGTSIGGISIPTGSLSLSLNAPPVKFTAPTIDYAFIEASSGTGKSVTYQ